MVSSRPAEAPDDSFENALEVLERRAGEPRLKTGIPELDGLMGGLEPGLFHLFYGSEKDGLADGLQHRLLVKAVKAGPGEALHELVKALGGWIRRTPKIRDRRT